MPRTVKKRKKLQWELSRAHTGVCKKESQKSLEKEKKEREKKEKEKKVKEKRKKSPATKEREKKEKTKERVKERKERAKTKERRAKACPKEMKERKRREKEKRGVQRRNRPEGQYTWRCQMMRNGVLGGSLREEGASLQRARRCQRGSLQQGDPQSQQSLQSHRQRSQQSRKGFSPGPRRQKRHQSVHHRPGMALQRDLQQPLLQRRLRHQGQGHHGVPSRKSTSSTLTRQPAVRSRCLHRHGRSKLCGTFHHGGKGKEVYLNKSIKDKRNIDLYYQKRKVKLYLNKSTRDTKNINLYYQKEEGKKEEEVSERKKGRDDEKKPRYKDEGKRGMEEKEKESDRDKNKVKKEMKERKMKEGLDKYKTKFEGKKKKKEEKEEEKKKNMDTNEVKCAQVSLCGPMRVLQKEVGSPKVWSSCVESESTVAKLLLVVMMTVFMYMFSVAEKNLKNMILDNATWQDWYLSGKWQDWYLSRIDRDRHPSRKGLSKANGFRKRRHVKGRLALVGQALKVMVFIGMDIVHATQHGPEANPVLAANGPAGSAQAPNADQVLAQALRQNTEALQALALSSGSGSADVSRNLEGASRILKNPDYFGKEDCTEAQFGLWKHQFADWLTFGDDRFRTLLETAESQSRESTMEDFTPEGKALSRKLHRILTSYLKGPALSITRAVRQTENGFLVWQRLNAEYRPLSRQRGMALAQVLATYPAFPKDKSVMECILALEEVVHQYNQVTGEEYTKSLLMGTLIRCSPPNLRQHLQLTLQDSSTYKSVKETMLLYEKTT